MIILTMLRKIVPDAIGLVRVCSAGVALRWLWKVATNLRACAALRSLQPADAAMGDGPFRARLGKSTAVFVGHQSISGVRDIWVRDMYTGRGFLQFREGDVVMDIGASMGYFTLLALGAAPGIRVVAVEASTRQCAKWRRVVAHNGWQDRAALLNVFVGGDLEFQKYLRRIGEGDGVPTISEAELVDRAGLTRLDFLKCDIEGSEFQLLRRESRLLAMARQIAIEVHAHAGSREDFEKMLRELGFEIHATRRYPHETILLARRRDPASGRGAAFQPAAHSP